MNIVDEKSREALLYGHKQVCHAHSVENFVCRVSTSTEVECVPSAACNVLRLHGNDIAQFHWGEGILLISHAGWPTVTTKSRLNALPGVHIEQRKKVWYLNGEEWDGDWTIIKPRRP